MINRLKGCFFQGQQGVLQMFRYLVFGVIVNAGGYLLYLAMTGFWDIDPKLAMSIGYVIGLVASFFGNRTWTFSYGGNSARAAVRFVLMHMSGYTFNLVCLYTFVDIYGYPHYIVQLCVMSILVLYFFMALKFFVFILQPRS